MRILSLLLVLLIACHPSLSVEQAPLGLNCSRKVGVPDHIPFYLASAAAGHQLADDHRLDLRVVLQLRDLDGLNAFLAAVTTPGTAAFGVPMSPTDFAARHLPTEAQANAAIAALRRHRLTVADKPVGALLHVSGTASQVHAAFATSVVRAAEGGGYMPAGEPQMPDEAIRAVQGLAQHLKPRTWAAEAAVTPQQPLSPQRIRQAYNMPADLQGAGQTLAIVGLDGFKLADMAGFAKAHGIREVPVKTAYIGGYDGRILSDGGQTETSLDLQLLSAVAPQADAIWAVLADQGNQHGLLDAFNLLANPPPDMPHIKHISCSWGTPETGLSQAAVQLTATVLKQLAATGATVSSASGDLGAFDDGTGTKVVDHPAASPWSLAVGGTSLQLGPPRVETTWSGSGGGYSCFWPVPRWQTMAWGQPEPGVMRALPDVALAADPATPYWAFVNGQQMAVAGTSAAAPVMAAIGALIAESRGKVGKSPLGFLPPLLYDASGKLPDNGFMDVTIGDSHGKQAPGTGEVATPFYDTATGLGSVDLTKLLQRLHELP